MVVNLGRTKRERAQLSPKMGKVHTNVWSENFKAGGLLKRLGVDKKKNIKIYF
jgi:RimJ/RimL family protein N-acetyltransferase